MKVRFNGKIYKKYGRKKDALSHLCKDIFIQYLKLYPNKNFSELKKVFKYIHSWKEEIILNEEEFKKFAQRRKDPYKRYFEIPLNGYKYYFTSQNWGKDNARNNMIEFAIKEGFDIEIL